MKAIVQDRYGPPDVLRLADVPQPLPENDEVLVRVRASAVNAADWHVMRGDPYLARLVAPYLNPTGGPKTPIRGRDVAGVVESVGRGVTAFHPGDQVFGDLGERDGAFAEYVCAPASLLAIKPTGLTFEQAAAVPLAGTTALTALRDVGQVSPGRRVLVNGASGGVGTFAVQIAKSLGAEVTAVCSARNANLVASLGADHVIDYRTTDFAHERGGYDVLLDLVGNRTLRALRRALTPSGVLVLSGGGVSRGGSPVGPMGLMIRGMLFGRFVSQPVHVLTVSPSAEKLVALRSMIESGAVRPVIDRTFPLSRVPDAIRYLEQEHASSKVVITF